MEELYEILEELQPEVDFKTAKNLIDGHLLDSLSIISLIAELEDRFDITIPAVYPLVFPFYFWVIES